MYGNTCFSQVEIKFNPVNGFAKSIARATTNP
jgi:hypothetical protein